MSSTPGRKRRPRRDAPRPIRVELSVAELATLERLSSYYGRTLSPVRRVIQLMSGGEMRAKVRFVEEETYWLRRFAAAQRAEMEERGDLSGPVELTPRTLVAYYGRTLGTLRLPRSRRRLSPQAVREREQLAAKLHAAVAALHLAAPDLVRTEIESRRLREREWIEDALREEGEEDGAPTRLDEEGRAEL